MGSQTRAATVATQDTSGEEWNNITGFPSTAPTVTMGHQDESSLFIAKNFGFSIQGSPTFTEINVTFTCAGGNGHIANSTLMLTKSGDGTPAPYSVNKSDDDIINGSPITKGGDLWGCSWNQDEFNSNNFGVLLRLENHDGNTAETGNCSSVSVEIVWQ